MEIEIRGRELQLLLEKEIYSVDVLHKCFYWYGNKFNVDISKHSETLFLVRLQSQSDIQDFQETIERIKRDLVDFKLRDIVTKETQTIRELIIAKAFAYDGLDDNPTTEVSDPVGYDPKSITPSERH